MAQKPSPLTHCRPGMLRGRSRAAKNRSEAAMRAGGSPVLVAALLSAVFTATAAAQGTAPDAFLSLAATGASAGNPLSAIPLGDLAETRARPLFSPSRRPPA